MSRRRSGRCADRVDHRVVVRQQFVVRDMFADFDIQVAGKPVVLEGRGEHVRHRLRSAVIGCNAGTHEAPRGRQLVEHLDLDVRPIQQGERRIARCRSSADDRDAECAEFRGWPCRDDDGGEVGFQGLFLEVRRVDIAVPGERGGQVVLGEYCADRARVGARSAVDAGVGVDVEHLGASEAWICGRRPDAVDRAFGDATRVVAASLRDHVWHASHRP